MARALLTGELDEGRGASLHQGQRIVVHKMAREQVYNFARELRTSTRSPRGEQPSATGFPWP